jgi:mRNA interferase YafQ
MRQIRRTTQFKRDYKREKSGRHHQALNENLVTTITALATDVVLPDRARDHALTGNWKDHRDCHIKPDLILIYRKPDADTLELIRLGSHSELGL